MFILMKSELGLYLVSQTLLQNGCREKVEEGMKKEKLEQSIGNNNFTTITTTAAVVVVDAVTTTATTTTTVHFAEYLKAPSFCSKLV
ncbi:hypothetical protein DPMN_101417 [Dreissena polymorpha]|uniref:Uncharacterized protein n=1 Tax=Dreissena polymorpha TaxID=45954 RepID=A0A9D4LHH8_DREPO|nr:hypothetical protein DPMN_101417 [Dreissena polymorpha]